MPPLLLLAGLATAMVGLPSSESMPGHPMSDLYDHAWGYAWFSGELLDGRLPLYTRTSHWPDGGSLWFVDPVGGLLATLLRPLPLGIIVGCVAWIQCFLNLASGYALGWFERQDRGAALVAAVVLGANPYVLSILHSGTLEYLNLAPLTLLWLALRAGRPGWAAAAWAWAGFGCFYYGAFGALLLFLALIPGVVEDGPRRVLRTTVYAALPLALVLVPAFLTLQRDDAVIRPESAPGWGYRSLPATDLLTFLLPHYWFPDNRLVGNQGILHANEYGFLVLGAAIWGLWRREGRPWRFAVAIAVILALGPALCVAGRVPSIGNFPVPLPAALLYLPGSPFRFIHHPYRLVVVPTLLLAITLARSFGGLRAMVLAAGILVESFFFSPALWPISRASAELPSLYNGLEGGIIDFPPELHINNRLYTLYGALHGQPIPYGVNSYVPEKLRKNAQFLDWIRCLTDGGLRATPREGGPPVWDGRPPRGLRLSPETIASGRKALLEWNYRWFVLHSREMDPSERDCLEARLPSPTREEEGLILYALPDLDRPFTGDLGKSTVP